MTQARRHATPGHYSIRPCLTWCTQHPVPCHCLMCVPQKPRCCRQHLLNNPNVADRPYSTTPMLQAALTQQPLTDRNSPQCSAVSVLYQSIPSHPSNVASRHFNSQETPTKPSINTCKQGGPHACSCSSGYKRVQATQR